VERQRPHDQSLKPWLPDKIRLESQRVRLPFQSMYKRAKLIRRKRIFEIFGFTEEVSDNSTTLRPPVTDLITGKANRRKLLRAWVEIGSWLSDFKRIHGMNPSSTMNSVTYRLQRPNLRTGRITSHMSSSIAPGKCIKTL